MNFGDILSKIGNAVGGAFNSDWQHPSVVGNVLQGKSWNQGIPDFGGDPVEPIAPIPEYQRLTPGMVFEQQLQDANDASAKAALAKNGTVAQTVNRVSPAPAVLSASVAPTVSPTVTPIPPKSLSDLQQLIQRGLDSYNKSSSYGKLPIATQAAALAQAGQGMPDPLLPTIKAIIETHGGATPTKGANNIYGMNADNGGVSYPDLQTAILGGGTQNYGKPQLGFKGLLNTPIYADYMKSGNLVDLLKHFTPSNDGNASYNDQIALYNSIKKAYFGHQ